MALSKGGGYYVTPEGVRNCATGELVPEAQIARLRAEVVEAQEQLASQVDAHKARVGMLQKLHETNMTLRGQVDASRQCIADIMTMVLADPTTTAQAIEARIRETFKPVDPSINPPQENPDAN
jgi:hypothetical protein